MTRQVRPKGAGNPSKREKIEDAVFHFQYLLKDVCPAQLGADLGVTAKEIVGILRETPGAYRKIRAQATRIRPRMCVDEGQILYTSSVWGFREVPA